VHKLLVVEYSLNIWERLVKSVKVTVFYYVSNHSVSYYLRIFFSLHKFSETQHGPTKIANSNKDLIVYVKQSL